MVSKRITEVDLATWASMTNRSFWHVEYAFREPIDQRACSWEELPREGMRRLMLVGPNGEFRSFDSQQGDRRFFQFGYAFMGFGEAAQVIGLLSPTDDDACLCHSWEYSVKQFVTFTDHFHKMEYRRIGALAPVILGGHS